MWLILMKREESICKKLPDSPTLPTRNWEKSGCSQCITLLFTTRVRSGGQLLYSKLSVAKIGSVGLSLNQFSKLCFSSDRVSKNCLVLV